MTFGGQPEEGAARVRALTQSMADLVRPGGLEGLRAIDLGAGGGELSAELALRGAAVVAVEGRAENAEAIDALREARGLGQDRLRIAVADVRALDWAGLGRFDIVVCSGLLYHLELDDQVELARAMRAACDRLAFVDTEIAWAPVEHRGGYTGHSFREHDAAATPEQRAAARLASLDNLESFWHTRASLHALLHDAGFSSSWELGAPGQPRRDRRATVVAIAGKRLGARGDGRPQEPPSGRVDRARIAAGRFRERLRRG